jgi:hypothetical protein
MFYLMINNVDKKGEIRAHPTAEQQALKAGEDITGHIRRLREG